MDAEFDFGLLQELTEKTGLVGFEDDVREVVKRKLRAETDSVTVDALGNIVGTLEGDEEYTVAVAAHMDEWGWMVKGVTDEGFLKLQTIGGTNPSTPISQRVTVRTDDEELMGVIGAVPPHMLTDDDLDLRPDGRDHPALKDDVYVELGLPPEEVKERVSPGDQVTLQRNTEQMGELVTGKSFDNRALVLVMLEAARRISEPAVTIQFVGSTQEEVGLRGAEGLATDLKPDLAIALDISVATDQPYFDDEEENCALGEGTSIKIKDRETITTPLVTRRLREVAELEGIPYQVEITRSGGTDAGAFQTVHGATPTGAVLLPARNIHSNTACAHVDDIDATIDLLTAFLESETGNDYTP